MVSFFFEYNSKSSIINKSLYYLVKTSEYYCAWRADKLITITKAMRDQFPSFLRKKFMIIPDGADIQKFRYISKSKSGFLLKKYKINKQKFIFNYTGGISKHEGLEFIILAAKELIKKIEMLYFLLLEMESFWKNVNLMLINYH